MLKRIMVGALLLTLALVAVACVGSESTPSPAAAPPPESSSAPTTLPSPTPAPVQKPSGPIKAKWIEPQVDGEAVYIPVSDVEKNWNTHFRLETQGGTMNFMAYLLDGQIYVRANVCPPCRSIGYSLEKDILVCDRCATTFKAKTGDGIQGACVDYPKALVRYEISDGNIILKEADLAVAYQNTLKPGWP